MSEFAYPLGGKQDYSAAQAGAFHGTRTSGVWSGEGNLKVTITGARQLTLSKGIAWLTTEEYWGKVYVNTSDLNFTLPVADAALDRICRLVIRWDKTANTATAQLLQGELAEVGEVRKIFQNPSSPAAKKLVFPSNPFDPSKKSNRVIRIVFDGLAASRPFIADLVEQTGLKVNILSANTKSVGGIGYGQMVLELPDRREDQETIIDFFQTSGLSLQEVEKE